MRRQQRSRSLSREPGGLVLPAVGTTLPLFNRSQLKRVESAFIGEGWGMIRRSAMTVLSMSGAELVKNISMDRAAAEALARLDDEIQEYLKYLRMQMQTLQTACARCCLALCFRRDHFELRYDVARVAGVCGWKTPDLLSPGPNAGTNVSGTESGRLTGRRNRLIGMTPRARTVEK